MRRFGGPVALVMAAAALVGCGGGNGAADVPTGPGAPAEGVDAYVEQARAADDTIRGSADRLTAGTTTGELDEILTDVEEAVRRLEQSTPPYDLLPAHQQLSQAMWDAVDAGHGIAAEEGADVAPGDLEPVVAALDEAAAALDEMEEKGYDVRRRT
jgi:hypothetical protein